VTIIDKVNRQTRYPRYTPHTQTIEHNSRQSRYRHRGVTNLTVETPRPVSHRPLSGTSQILCISK